ncbi:MAG TPA: DUF1269 domain-containing protein [Thermoleophilaceae bacterium]
MDSVIAVTFGENSKAYDALTKLKEMDDQRQVSLSEAAVVVRREDGQLDTKDVVGDDGLTGTASGGIVGLIIGILGGPFGVLLGGAMGLLIGSLFDIDDDEETDSVLAELGRTVQVGRSTLLAQVGEQSPEVLDAAMAELGGTILRRDVDDVEAEIAAAEEAQRAAKRAARKELRDQRRSQAKEKIHAKIEELKAKLHRHPVGAGSSH